MSAGSRSRIAPSVEPQSALELALLGGGRLRFGNLALDLLAGPAALGPAIGSVDDVGPAPASEPTEPDPSVVPRLLVATHLGFAARSTIRGFVGIEAEVGSRGGSAELPLWMAGLSAGVTVGTQ